MLIADIQLRAEAHVPKGWPPGIVIGGLLASTFVVQLIVSPRWGRLGDRVGRKPIVIFCTLLSAAAMICYGLAGSIWVLLLSRILSGLGAANVAVAQALISDLYSGAARTAALGRVGAAISAGLIVGAPLGGFLAEFGNRTITTMPKQIYVGMLAGGASLIGALFLAVAIPRTAPKEPTAKNGPPLRFGLLGEFPKLRPLLIILSAAWFSLATLEGTFARLLKHLLGYDQSTFGILFGYESLLSVLVQAFVIALVVNKWSDRLLLRVTYFLQGLGLALTPAAAPLAVFLPPMVSLFIASTLYAVGSGVANPIVNGLCSRQVPDDRQAELFGLLQSSRSFGFVAGPVLGGFLFDWKPAAPYLVAGAVCGLVSVSLPFLDRQEPAIS